jgi:hypothetical protein
LGDALDDGQAEADTCVVGCAWSALKRLGKRGNQLRGERLARALDGERHAQPAPGMVAMIAGSRFPTRWCSPVPNEFP